MRSGIFTVGLAASAFLLASCESYVQTTSGQDYLDRAAAAGVELDDEMKEAAAVEPLLTFPARIGIARIENGALTDIPSTELDLWMTAVSEQENSENDYVPVNLFITDLVAPYSPGRTAGAGNRAERRREIIRRLQLGGARQHLDAILVYEVFGRTDTSDNVLSIMDLTVIGAYIAPSRRLNTHAHAAALLFDVRNGYPYGAADASVSREGLSPTAYTRERSGALLAASEAAAVERLTPKISDMMAKLRSELASVRSSSQP